MTTPPIDPGSEPAKIGISKLPDLIAFVRRNPYCTLKGGEAKLLVDEIDRLLKVGIHKFVRGQFLMCNDFTHYPSVTGAPRCACGFFTEIS